MRPLLSLFYPHLCPMCNNYIGEEVPRGMICPECDKRLPRTEQAAMRENSTEMELWGDVKSRGAAKRVMHLEQAAAYLFYEKDAPIRQLIHKMKYADQPEIGYWLGREAAMEFSYADFFRGVDYIVPVPLHPKRFRSRGYNQSEFIARGISEVTEIPIDTSHLTRVRNTPKQAMLDKAGRQTNVTDAFEVNHPEQFYHKHLLIVDDLITTGGTMRACLQAMKRFRGATFSVFALCKTH